MAALVIKLTVLNAEPSNQGTKLTVAVEKPHEVSNHAVAGILRMVANDLDPPIEVPEHVPDEWIPERPDA